MNTTRWKAVARRALGLLTPAVALLLIAMMYFLGVYSERTGFVDQVLDPGLKRITHPVLNAFGGKPPVVHQLQLVLKDDTLDSLRAVRDQALLEGWLSVADNPRFACTVQADGRQITGLVNLKEGTAERLRDRHWPFHLRLHAGDTVQGMQGCDLLPVRDASVLHAWVFGQALHREGLPAFLYRFTDLRINGRDHGLYVMEGRLDSTALLRWGRGRGPVMRFDDGLLENTRKASAQRAFASDAGPQADWLSAPVLALRMQQVLADPAGALRYRQAVQALEDLRAGRLPARAVLDVDPLARLLALSDLLGAQESTAWWNLRFLADSTSGKLLAIPQRGIAGTPINALQVLQTREPLRFPARSSGFHERLFGDSLLYVRYIAYLDTFSTAGWLEDLLLGTAHELGRQERIVSGELPQAQLDRRIYEHCRTVIRQTLRPHDLALAYTQDAQGTRRRIAVANVHALPLVVRGSVTGTDTVALSRPVVLWPRERDKPLSYTYLTVEMPPGQQGTMDLLVEVLGLPERRRVAVRAWSTFSAN